MASKREGIIDAVVTALGAATAGGTTKPTGLDVHRMRTRPIEDGNLPALVVYLVEEENDRDSTMRTDRKLRFAVEARAEVPEDTPPDTAIDPLLVWIVKALLVDYTLGGLLSDLAEMGTTWESEERSNEVARAAVTFEATYLTSYKDPEAVG